MQHMTRSILLLLFLSEEYVDRTSTVTKTKVTGCRPCLQAPTEEIHRVSIALCAGLGV
jgi:hypothetical protein